MTHDEDRPLRFYTRLSSEKRALWGVQVLTSAERGTTDLAIAHPAGLVAFAGYLKRTAGVRSVFCRGESSNHPALTPSLLRSVSPRAPLARLLAAEELVERGVRKRFSMTRFSERDISALLQHYGVRTTWVDLVDNLFIAVWFALTEGSGSETSRRYGHSKQPHGWIKFVQPSLDGLPQLRVKDLRCEFFQHSLRPHAQHGLSVTRYARSQWTEQNTDLRDYVIGRVQIPNEPARWRLSGFMFRDTFLFPGPDHDSTYRTLRRKAMASLLRLVEQQQKLPERVLGVIERLK